MNYKEKTKDLAIHATLQSDGDLQLFLSLMRFDGHELSPDIRTIDEWILFAQAVRLAYSDGYGIEAKRVAGIVVCKIQHLLVEAGLISDSEFVDRLNHSDDFLESHEHHDPD